MSGWAERAALILADVSRDPTPEAVMAAQDTMETLAEEAAASGDQAELEGVQEAAHPLEMIADYVLDPVEHPTGYVLGDRP